MRTPIGLVSIDLVKIMCEAMDPRNRILLEPEAPTFLSDLLWQLMLLKTRIKKWLSSPWRTSSEIILWERVSSQSRSTANASYNSMTVEAMRATLTSSAVFSISASVTYDFSWVARRSPWCVLSRNRVKSSCTIISLHQLSDNSKQTRCSRTPWALPISN